MLTVPPILVTDDSETPVDQAKRKLTFSSLKAHQEESQDSSE